VDTGFCYRSLEFLFSRSEPMLFFRSLTFNILFYVNLIVWMLIGLPGFLLPRRMMLYIIHGWVLSSFWLLKTVAGIRVAFHGYEHIPDGACLVAAKHQSLWETFALFVLFKDPVFVLKRELLWIPFFGWYAWKTGMIAVHRGRGARAIPDLKKKARLALEEGRQILLFPEGTRRAPGAPPAYRQGIVHLYEAGNVPCLPVALNSGLFWPRRQFLKYPGTIRVECLPPLPPGIDRETFFSTLQNQIEATSDRLMKDAV
jgi:1-acyl-sn-glycerol-3-phosphate acyltransferase